MAQLINIGLSHRHAPAAVREQVARQRPPLADLLAALAAHAAERIVLSTCHRFELYAVVGSRHDPAHWIDRLGDVIGVPAAFAADHLVLRTDSAVVEHLMRVASGLDSKVLGEDQVLAQVRQAYLAAIACGSVGPVLSALFRGAIHAGRRVRRDTGLNVTPRSLARLAIDQVVTAPATARVVVLGTGAMAEESVRGLRARGVGRITVISRHLERARRLHAHGATDCATFEHLAESLGASSHVIACTTAPRYLIDADVLAGRSRPLVIVDLGMPRNADPALGEHPGVQLTHLDDLPEYRALCSVGVTRAHDIVTQERDRFARWIRDRRGPRLLDIAAAESAA